MIQSIFHLHPGENWMNDPNGPVFWNGNLHMFYQRNPFGPEWGDMTWGHAVSPDMVHWSRLPDALLPDQPYDKQGVFSGCCVVKDDIPHIFYTGVYPECVCLAKADRAMKRFQKDADNPILCYDDKELLGWRDPFIWQEADGYHMALGAAKRGQGTWVEHYHSVDLKSWTRRKDLARSAEGSEDIIWECPNLLLGKDQNAALVVSAVPGFVTRVMMGSYREGQFTPKRILPYELGDCFYAPNTVRHPDGRLIQFGWMRECGDESARVAQGWQGMLTLPRVVCVGKERVTMQPAQEVALLREEVLLSAKERVLEAGERLPLAEEPYIELVLECAGKTSFSLELFGEANISFRPDGEIRIDFAGASGGANRTLHAHYPASEKLSLRMFLDGTALELYINDEFALSSRIYPSDHRAGHSLLPGEPMACDQIQVFRMANAYCPKRD